MKKLLDEIILDEFPLEDYELNRKTQGCMQFVRQEQCRQLTKGVVFHKNLYHRGDGKDVWVYLTVISPDAQGQLAVSAAPLCTAMPVVEHAVSFERAFDEKVLLAMNASYFHFFNNGDLTPYGIQIVRGVEMALPALLEKKKPWYSHNFLAVDKSGKAFVCNSEDYYRTWRGKLAYAVGGGLRLIRDREITLHRDQHGFAPRTTVAIASDGTVILMCADGRTKCSAGLSYGDIIDLHLQLGFDIFELLNLDGGGSTTVVLRDEDGVHRVKNVPSGPPLPISYERYGIWRPEPCGTEQARSVADALLVISK